MKSVPVEDFGDYFEDVIGPNAESIGPRGYLDTGIPELNFAMSGDYRKGIAQGRMHEIFGPASCGKTFLATMIMIACQRQGGIPVFADHERSFEPKVAQSLGLDISPSRFRYIKPQTFEQSVDLAYKTAKIVRDKGMPLERPIVWVFDSVAAMIPHEKMFDEKGNLRAVGDYNMRDKLALATATSQSYPSLAQFAEDYNMTTLLLNQIRLKPGVLYGDPTTTPGGNAAEFYCSTRTSLGKAELRDKDKSVVGFKVAAKMVKNKVARPFLTAAWQVRFNPGLGVMVDQIATNVDFLVRKGLIEKSGNYLVWEGKKLYQSELENRLKADPDGVKKLYGLIPEVPDEFADVNKSEYLDDVDGMVEVDEAV